MTNYNISTTTEQVKINPIVEIKHEDLFVSSLNIAAVFGINHKNVLRDIRNLKHKISKLNEKEESSDLSSPVFKQDVYLSEQNKACKCYLLNEEAFILTVMRYTTPRALEFQLKYIQVFKAMRSELLKKRVDPRVEIYTERAKKLFSISGIEGNQLMIALDNLHKSLTGESLIQLSGVKLISDSQEPLYSPTQLGERLGISAVIVNLLLQELHYQYKKFGKWELTEEGKVYGVYVDSPRKMGNGSIRWINWRPGVENKLRALIK